MARCEARHDRKAATTDTSKAPGVAPRATYSDGQGGGDFYQDGRPTNGTNGVGNRTVSTLPPSGGQDGDIWYQV